MIGNNITIIVVFVLYLVMMLVIGVVAFRRTSNTTDYYLGGRSLGKWVVSISAQASDMNGWLLIYINIFLSIYRIRVCKCSKTIFYNF